MFLYSNLKYQHVEKSIELDVHLARIALQLSIFSKKETQHIPAVFICSSMEKIEKRRGNKLRQDSVTRKAGKYGKPPGVFSHSRRHDKKK